MAPLVYFLLFEVFSIASRSDRTRPIRKPACLAYACVTPLTQSIVVLYVLACMRARVLNHSFLYLHT